LDLKASINKNFGSFVEITAFSEKGGFNREPDTEWRRRFYKKESSGQSGAIGAVVVRSGHLKVGGEREIKNNTGGGGGGEN